LTVKVTANYRLFGYIYTKPEEGRLPSP